MSVEFVGTGRENRMVFAEMPALIGREAAGPSRNEASDTSYLCLISQVEGELVVWDLGGNGGLSVNGAQVTRATLKDSDTLGLGGKEYQVHTDPRPRRYFRGVRN